MKFPHEITVFRQAGEAWERHYIDGVLWQDCEDIAMQKSGLRDGNTLALYIPFSVGFDPLQKDIVLFGTIDYEIVRKPSELFAQGKARTVTMVDAYDFGRLKHYKVGGK